MARLGEVFTLQMGKTPARANDAYWNDGSNKWVSIADLSSFDKYVANTKETITDLAVSDSGIKIVPANTVIMSFKLSLGKTAITKEPVYTNEAIMAFIPKGKCEVDTDYLYHMLSGKDWTKGTNRAVMGATLNKATLGEIEMSIPLLDQQQKIAEVLDKVCELISYRKQQLDKVDLLVKARFVELFGNVRDNEKNWEKVSLKSVAEVRGRVGWKGYKKDDLRESGPLVLGATHLTESGCIDLSSPVYLSREKYEESPEIMLQKNDLIFTQRGNTIGKVGLLENDIGEATINPCVLILRPLTINPIYFKTYFILDETKSDMWSLNAGSAQPMITQKGIGEYMLMLPPLELQEQFAAFVKQTDKSKLAVQNSIDKLEILKKSLMQKYFG